MKTQEIFESLLVDFRVYLQSVLKNKKTQQDYLSYVKTLHKNNDGQTLKWLKDALRSNNPIVSLEDSFDKYFADKGVQPNSQWKTGLVYLGKCVCGHTSAVANLNANRNFDLIACQLVAQFAIFCSVEVFKQVQDGELGSKDNKGIGNQEGAWYHHTIRRARPKEKCRTIVDNIYLDDNTYANKAIKTAVLTGLKTNKQYGSLYVGAKFTGYESCHIWDKTCYDERYHTSVGNLVLLPRTIASLTDHCDEVKKLLKYEAWIRFGFIPQDEAEPQKPKYYKDIVWK
jgi:hypothetical protein